MAPVDRVATEVLPQELTSEKKLRREPDSRTQGGVPGKGPPGEDGGEGGWGAQVGSGAQSVCHKVNKSEGS